MKVLMHYTTKQLVFDDFSRNGAFSSEKKERINQISDFYNKYNRSQEHLFFVVCYYNLDNNTTKYTACKVKYNDVNCKYEFFCVSPHICELICSELGLNNSNTYDKDTFYKVFTIEDDEKKFKKNNKEIDLNKIRLKFFSWEELLVSSEILFDEITNILFTEKNVLKVASTYKPSIKYSSDQFKRKYFDALLSIGFIAKDGVNTDFTILHGDIGEFIMHIMLSEFLCEQSSDNYIYPKLVFKTSPKMPVYGNDGTIYVKDKNEIYYLEAKFYSDLNKAINKAVESLKNHNEVSQENLNHRIELFRNIKTDSLDEIVEIDKDTLENLVIFLICDNYNSYEDILETVRKNSALSNLKENFSIIVFVLPILSKKNFLKFFQNRSEMIWGKLNEKQV